MATINMLSRADSIKGQGVLSAYEEQVRLVSDELQDSFKVYVNQFLCCDIMHYHTINFPYFLTLPFARLRGETVGYVHFIPDTLDRSIHLPSLVQKFFYWYVIQFYKNMDYLVTVNPDFKEKLAAYHIPKEKIYYIPNFVSSENFHPLTYKERCSLRENLGIGQEQFVVLCAGQLQKRKGIFDFIEVARRMPQATFLWAGNFAFGAISDGYHEIQKIVENPPDNVRFLGLIEREKMNGVYNIADVMFLPSFEELFPMTVLEAMSCGIPIVLRDLSLYENILFDFYLKGDSIHSFIDLLQKLQSDKGYYHHASALSTQGHQYYSKEHVSQMWKDFYCSVVNGRIFRQKKPAWVSQLLKGLVGQRQ